MTADAAPSSTGTATDRKVTRAAVRGTGRSPRGQAGQSGHRAGELAPGWRTAVRCAAVMIAAGSVGLCFGRAFPLGAVVRPVLVAAAVPVVATMMIGLVRSVPGGRDRRLPRWAEPLACAMLWYPTAWLAITLSPAAAPGHEESLVAGLLDAPVRILESTLPVRPTPALVVLPFTMVWLVATLGVLLLRRHHDALVPVVPALFGLVGAVLLAVPRSGPEPAALGVAVAAGLLAVTDGAERDWTRRRLLAAVLILGFACSGGLAAGGLPAWGGKAVVDPRDHVNAAPHRWSEISPLSRVSGWLIEPERPLFEVTRTGGDRAPAAATRWRLAVLDRYDGRIWTASARPTPAGLEVPRRPAPPGGPAQPGGPASPQARLGEPVRERVVLRELTGSFLPTREELVGLDGPDLSVDIPTGTVASRVPVAAGDGYELTFRPLPAPPEEYLAPLPAATPPPGAYRAPPAQLRAEVRQVADRIRASALDGHTRASTLARWLSSGFTLDVTAPGGHSEGDVDAFLRRERPGTPELFAAAFAAVAHELGLHVRIVVGFDLPAGADSVVRAGSATAWPEVEFETAGWVAYAPTPAGGTGRSTGIEQVDGGRLDPGGDGTGGRSGGDTDPQEDDGIPPNVELEPEVPPPPPEPLPPLPEAVTHLLLISTVVIGTVLAIYLLAVVTVPRAVRTAWRTDRSSRLRVTGAWNDLILELRDSGVMVPVAATRLRIVDLAADRAVSAGTARHLSGLAAQALYGRDLPWGDAADDAWRQADRLRRQVRAARPWPVRLVDRLHPRRLRRPNLRDGGWLGPRDVLRLMPIVRWWTGTGVWTRHG